MYDLYQKMKSAPKKPDVMLELINQFRPIIMKYSYLLRLELDDAISDLTVELIRIINEFPGRQEFISDFYILSYIKKAVRHAYIALSKKQTKNDFINSREFAYFEQGYEPENTLWLEDMFLVLTDCQKKVITLRYIYDYSDIEIAKSLNISRQAVNQIKNRAFQKLKPFIQQ